MKATKPYRNVVASPHCIRCRRFRYRHRKQIKRLFQALLPAAGTEIKGHQQSVADLAAVNGLGVDDKDFVQIMRLLDRELRLITPVDTLEVATYTSAAPLAARTEAAPGPLSLPSLAHDAIGGDAQSTVATNESQHEDANRREYQLAHDYLVPSLRDWLADDQKMTLRGRTELLLADRAAMWAIKKEKRQLPSGLECIRILLLTERRRSFWCYMAKLSR